MCRCRASNDKGSCHSCSHKKKFLSTASTILFCRPKLAPGQIKRPPCHRVKRSRHVANLWERECLCVSTGLHFSCLDPRQTDSPCHSPPETQFPRHLNHTHTHKKSTPLPLPPLPTWRVQQTKTTNSRDPKRTTH